MIAVVIFGIFLSLSYWLFQDEMQGVLASLVNGVKSGTLVTMDKTLVGDYELGGNETPNIPEEVLVPNAESDFTFDSITGTITGYKGTRKDVVIPSTIKGVPVLIIGTDSFREKGLTSVYIPEGVVKVDTRAFYINSLETVHLPDSLTSIIWVAFGYNNLTSIKIPKNIKTLDYSVFSDNKLTSVELPEGLKTIGQSSFANNNLTSINLPESLTLIDREAFSNNQLTSVRIPKLITKLDYGEFYGNPITKVEMAEGTTYRKAKPQWGNDLPTFQTDIPITITYYPR